uniref:G-protein coupled receptors family 1 profile domain-containing protein n=1 Tax=Sphaeramia orbicularis TaxID=375764 RepID=A0A672YTE1_9TELE
MDDKFHWPFTYLSSLQSPWNFTNYSSSTSPPPAVLVVSPNMAYMAAELIIAFLSTVGNVLVCVAVGINRKLRTVTNYFLVSLAVADICVGTIAIPCAILTDIGLPHHNLHLCLLMLSVLIMFTQNSIFSLLAVAVERYLAIFMPFRYQMLMTPRNAVLVILAKWLLAITIGLVPLMVIMSIIYARIFYTVKQQVRRIAFEQGAKGEAQMRAAANIRREMKMAVSLFLVLFLFAVCWIPLHVINCFLLMCPRCYVPFELLLTAIILSHANSAVNPFLYAYTMTTFRDTFKAIFLCCRTRMLCCRPHL